MIKEERKPENTIAGQYKIEKKSLVKAIGIAVEQFKSATGAEVRSIDLSPSYLNDEDTKIKIMTDIDFD